MLLFLIIASDQVAGMNNAAMKSSMNVELQELSVCNYFVSGLKPEEL